MAKGKFSQPRTPKREEYDIDQAFRQVTKQTSQQPTEPVSAPEEEVISPAMERNKKIVLITLCVLALVVLIGAGITVGVLFGGLGDDGLILNNVHVAGINLGGMTQDQAEAAIRAVTKDTYTNVDMVVYLPDQTLVLSPADTGANLDVAAAAQAAYEYGRTGGLSEREAAKNHVLTGEYNIALLSYLSLDTAYIRAQLDTYGASFNSTYAASSYKLEGTMPSLEPDDFDEEAPCQTLILNPGAPGRNLDIDALYNRILDAYSFNTFEVDARDSAPQEDPKPLDLDAIYEEVYVEPVNASMDMETFEVTPEIYGYGFDLENAKTLLSEAEANTEIRISLEYLIPEVLGEGLEEVLFRDVLGSCETEHTNNENRNNNLRLACAAIDGMILMPGDEFSYNDALGKRTTEAGYLPAAAYSGGQTVNEVGGGICQVSSTLYYCTFFADLEITSRKAHSYVSSYIPLGMDATVSWGGPEFKFVNNTNYPIRIDAEVSDGYVKVQIVGTDDKDYYVEMDYNILSYTPFETVYEEYPEDNEKGYTDGHIIQTPYDGYIVRTFKCKYDKETKELISREEFTISDYNDRDMIVVKIISEEPTDPSTEATDPSTETTDPSTESTTPAPPEETLPPDTTPPETESTSPPASDPPASSEGAA